MQYPITDESCQGAIYILTNPMFNAIKIGYATDVDARCQDLSHSTAIPLDFEVYAYYEVSKNAVDKTLHSLISLINPELRVNPSKEFFNISKEDAYQLLLKIATISDTENRLHLINDIEDLDTEENKKSVRSPFRFNLAKIPFGSKLIFDKEKLISRYGETEMNLDIEATVVENDKILYNNKILRTSRAAVDIACQAYPDKQDIWLNGSDWWIFENETLWDRRMRMEKEGTYGNEM